MSQFVQIFEKLRSSDPSELQGDKLPGVGEDLVLEVKHEIRWTKGTSVNMRSHNFLSDTTRCRSGYHHATWYSVDGKSCWIEAPLHRGGIWEIVDVLWMEYKPPTNSHTGRLIVTARTTDVDIKHPFSTTVRRGESIDSGTALGVCLRVPNVIEISFRSYAMDSQPVQVGMGKLPSDTSGLFTRS
jgi:hypothetical protein